ncbi:hypothetical protein [Pelosinus baikalensis]|uniref:Uncharacterized protein n=1 Tax=Pelosinus baikalensis TaxID=2892015 RepID=A0ABS8I036_9FIRM|nr:hypothetical protein [Pelosinus baikalensis]MCC5468625.1 hypothetical protein [Pelosinus baikalensis]
MFYLFKNSKCETICEDKSRLEGLIENEDTDATIVENDSWLNPSDLTIVDGKIKVITITQTAEEIKTAKLTALDADYQPRFASLAQSIGLATLDGDQTVIDGIKTDYATLKNEYQAKKEEIENGN